MIRAPGERRGDQRHECDRGDAASYAIAAALHPELCETARANTGGAASRGARARPWWPGERRGDQRRECDPPTGRHERDRGGAAFRAARDSPASDCGGAASKLRETARRPPPRGRATRLVALVPTRHPWKMTQ